MNDHPRGAPLSLLLILGLVACLECSGCRSAKKADDLAALEDLVDAHLLQDGTLTRDDRPIARFVGTDPYAAAHATIERLAAPALRKLVADPTNYSALVFMDGTVRQRLNADGKTMTGDASEVAPGRITVSQYVVCFNAFAEQATPALLAALRDPGRAAALEALGRLEKRSR